MPEVIVYGADWCEDTQHTRKFLESRGVEYRYVDIESDADALAWVKEQNGGRERKPTIKIGEVVLSVPSDEELLTVLEDTEH